MARLEKVNDSVYSILMGSQADAREPNRKEVL